MNDPDKPFSLLPKEIILEVFSHLEPNQLLIIECCCNLWREISQDYWKKRCYEVAPEFKPITDESWKIQYYRHCFLNKFELLREREVANHFKVIQCRHRKTNKLYLQLSKNVDHTFRFQHQEIPPHPFLLEVLTTYIDGPHKYSIYPWKPVERGLLYMYTQGFRATESCIKFYIAEVALGVQHLLDSGILVADYECLFVDENGHIFLFGWENSCYNRHSPDSEHSTTHFSGSPEYFAAPEVIRSGLKDLSPPAAWWSFGCFVYELLNGRPPFYSDNIQKMYQLILTGELKMPPSVTDLNLKSLLSALLERDPSKRIKHLDELKAHPFLADVDWDKAYKKQLTPEWIPKEESETIIDDLPFVTDVDPFAAFTYRPTTSD